MSWSLKWWVFGSSRRVKQYRFLVTSGFLLSRKVWWAARISSFWLKIELFYRPLWNKDGTPDKNEFWVFSNSEMLNVTNRVGKLDGKNGVICLVSMFPSWVIVLKLSRNIYLMLISSRNLCLLKQFACICLKGLVTHIQKMVLFIMLWRTVLEILGFGVKESC